MPATTTRQHERRVSWRALAAALALVGTLLPTSVVIATPAAAAPDEPYSLRRLGGLDRYATAAEVAIRTHDRADRVLLARGDVFADALVASVLAGGEDRTPILLTPPDQLGTPARLALTALDAKEVQIVGGTDAVRPAVADELTRLGFRVRRLGGADRYDTARAVAVAAGAAEDEREARTAVLVGGREFPDAVVAAALSYGAGFPLLLTEPGALSRSARDAITRLGVSHVIVLGGPAAVSVGVDEQVRAVPGVETITPLAGANRHQTAGAVMDYAVLRLGFSRTIANLAPGDQFWAIPPTLAGGEAGAATLLTEGPAAIGTDTCAQLAKWGDGLTGGILVGGAEVVRSSVITDARKCADGAVPVGGS